MAGSLRGVSSSRIIILHVTNPDVPFLDLVDMPGLVSVPSGNEPSDLASQTLALVKGHIQSEHGANSLYLAVVKATIAPNISVALQLLHEADVCEKTFGVFTFCDELGRKNARRLEQWVRKPQGTQLTCFTSTKVQMLTQQCVRVFVRRAGGRAPGTVALWQQLMLSLLALVVQK
jgi:hypothetical protein